MQSTYKSKQERDNSPKGSLQRMNGSRDSRFDERKNARKNKRKFQEMSLQNAFRDSK